MSRKICLVSHGHPAANPRLVREAHALHEAGYEVTVVTPRFVPRWMPFDREILSAAGWKYRFIDLLDSRSLRWNYLRARRLISAKIARWMPSESLVSRACNYANPELARMAAKEKADLYIAHQHHALPAAANAARRNGTRFAFDAEDLLADSSTEPQDLIRNIERRYVPKCAYVSTMSRAAARRLKSTNRLTGELMVLHNTPRIADRAGILPPGRRPPRSFVSIYWFGQTIGPHSRAEQVLKALPLLPKPARLVLRGAPQANYVRGLEELAQRLGVRDLLQVEPLAPPDRMVVLAADHDILLGTQPGTEQFHQLAIGNKVFTGMVAGLALALTDTVAHRDLLTEASGCGFLFADNDENRFAQACGNLLADRDALARMQQSSWDWADRKFNWERESQQYIDLIERVLAGASE